MKTLKRFLLNEKTFAITKDVDYLYKKYVKKVMDGIKAGKVKKMPKTITISSKELKSKDAKKAHAVNPVSITMFSKEGNGYNPIDGEIYLSPHAQITQLMLQSDIDTVAAENLWSKKTKRHAKREVATDVMLSSINHELTHWIDDSLHNRHIKKSVSQAYYANTLKAAEAASHSRGAKTSVGSDFEITAVINGMKQIKRKTDKKEWDRMSWEDLIDIVPILGVTVGATKATGTYDRWRKLFLKRMAREKLLGKNMKFT